MTKSPCEAPTRSRRPIDGGEPGPTGGTGLRPVEILVVGLCFGVATGLVEMSGTLVAAKLMGRITYDALRTNWHYVWMTPLSNLSIFLSLACLLSLATVRLPRLRSFRLAVFGFAYVSAWALVSLLPALHRPAEVVLALGLACAATRFLGRRRTAFLGLAPRFAVAGAVLIAAIAAGDVLRSAPTWNSRASDDGSPSGGPNVVLMVLDTVRADSLTPYGAERDTTPNLSRLARQGVKFEHARSPAPWTLPSHASLFTSRWPFELTADVGRPLDDAYPTLAERLADRGYAAGAFVANTENCNAWYGLDRGFDRFEDFYENSRIEPMEVLRSSRLGRYVATTRLGRSIITRTIGPLDYRYRKSAAMINRDALAWLSDQDDRPFFLFLNYFDVHDPYVPPPEAERRFTAAGGQERTAAELARDAYDDCLHYLDDQLGRLLSELERRGKLQNTLVVVTSDHGEGFGEHGLSGHGVSLYRSELHIPLLLVHPTLAPAGTIVDEPVSLRDVAPTILDVLGLDAAPTFAGRSLATTWSGPSDSAAPPEPVLSEVDRAVYVPNEVEDAPARLGRMRAITAKGRTYILNGDGREELYDLDDDPEEQNDLAALADVQEQLNEFRELMEQVAGDGATAE